MTVRVLITGRRRAGIIDSAHGSAAFYVRCAYNDLPQQKIQVLRPLDHMTRQQLTHLDALSARRANSRTLRAVTTARLRDRSLLTHVHFFLFCSQGMPTIRWMGEVARYGRNRPIRRRAEGELWVLLCLRSPRDTASRFVYDRKADGTGLLARNVHPFSSIATSAAVRSPNHPSSQLPSQMSRRSHISIGLSG